MMFIGNENIKSVNVLSRIVFQASGFRNPRKCDFRRNLLDTHFVYGQHVRNFKPDLKIKWVRPKKISCIKPEKSGDLKSLPPVDLSRFPLEIEKSTEINGANNLVKRVLSLRFSPRSKVMEVVREEMLNKVKRHTFDRNTSEARIAYFTAAIRDLQEHMENFPRDKRSKVQLKELIDRRKKQLKYLRRWDYKRFEWLLEKLDLIYRPPPNNFHWVTRKDSLQKLTDKYCEGLKQERLAAYRKMLESQQMSFLQEKVKKLKWIIQEENACGVEPTVSECDIEQVVRQLKELELKTSTTEVQTN